MKFKNVLGTLLIALLLLALPSLADVTTKKGFLAEVKAAIEAKDADAFMRFYNLEGAPKEFVPTTREFMERELKDLGKIKSILYTPRTAIPNPPFPQDGFLWVPNMKALGNITVTKADGLTWDLPYGKTDKGYCFPGVKKLRKVPTDGNVQITVNPNGRLLTASLNNKPLQVSGGRSMIMDITGYCQAGSNRLNLRWTPDSKASKELRAFNGKVTVTHYGSNGKAVFEETVELEAQTGQAVKTFKL